MTKERPPVCAAILAAPKRKKRLRKADTNVLRVEFNRLLQPGNEKISFFFE